MVEVAEFVGRLLCWTCLIYRALSRLSWLCWVHPPLLVRLAPPYKGGGGRLTCRVLVGYIFLLQVSKVSPCPNLTVESACWATPDGPR